MNFGRIFASALARRIAYVVVALALGALGVGQARAQDYSQCNDTSGGALCPNQGEAAAAAYGWAHRTQAGFTAACIQLGHPDCATKYPVPCRVSEGTGGFPVRGLFSIAIGNGGNCDSLAASAMYSYPVGATCATAAPATAGTIVGTMYSGGVCNNGCKMEPINDDNSDGFTMLSGGITVGPFRKATWKPTGGTCSTLEGTPQQPAEQKQGCHTTSSGHTVCKGDGKTCITTASGFKTCASDPNSTGKVATNNPRTEAASISAPNTPASAPANRPGESWTSTETTTITNTTTGDVTNNTTYNNTGTPNGNQPVPGDGAGQGEEGEEEGDDHGTVGGDGACGGSFTCSGGDPVLCAVAQQTYAARCEAEGRFGDGPGDFPGDGDGGAGEDPDPAESHQTVTIGLGNLDDTGFLGGGSCPDFGTITTSMGSFGMDDAGNFCAIIGVARTCLIFLGAFMALGILMGWNS